MVEKEEYLEFIDELIKQEGEALNTEQRKIIKGILKGDTYEDIKKNEQVYINITNIKKNMTKKIFPLLQEVIEKKYGIAKKIGKKNLVAILESCYKKYKKESKSDNVIKIFQSNDIKLEISNKLRNHFQQWNQDKKSKYAKLIKNYWLKVYEHNEEKSKKIDDKTIEEIFELIIDLDEDKANIINIFSSLAKNISLEESMKSWFEMTTIELTKAFIISKEDFQDWTANPIELEKRDNFRIVKTSIYEQNYLSLKIRKSDSRSSNHKLIGSSQYRIESAYFLPDNFYPPHPNSYKNLNKIIEKYEEEKEYKEYYSLEELKHLLTRLIEKSCSQFSQRESILIIDFFCDKELLSTNFDCWKCEILGDNYQLKEIYRIRVRCLSRLDPLYLSTKGKEKWDKKWKFVNEEFKDSDEGETWMNLCRSKPEDLNNLFKRLLKYGIPIAIWSRYHQKYEQHHEEINNIVTDCQGNVRELPKIVGDRRMIDEDENIENLAHHLSLLWEDPNLIPPFASLNSAHVGK